MNKFAERLKYLRKIKGVTQAELSNYLGYRCSSISNYENTGHQPDYDTLMKITEYLGVSIDFLLGADDSSKCENFIPEEVELLKKYRKLSLEEKQILLQLIEMFGIKERSTVQENFSA